MKPEALRHVSAERTAPNVLTVRVDVASGRRFRALLRSDAHHDNAHTDQAMERKHLREAVERGAAIIDIGDLHCAMQGKWDRRASRDAMRPEYQSGNYLDRLVECAADFYEPYADYLLHMSVGNHETSITKMHETDLTDRTVNALRERGAVDLTRGSYAGWIALRFNYSNRRRSFIIRYTHGYGGGGMMTHGILATRREASQFPDAHLLWSGHTHDSWSVDLARERLSTHGVVYSDTQTHIKTAGYKPETLEGAGWAVERGSPPKPLGAAWLEVWMDSNGIIHHRIEVAR